MNRENQVAGETAPQDRSEEPSLNVLSMPFQIGQSWWLPKQSAERLLVACPVCAGNRVFTVVLGTGEQLSLPCDSCGIGYEGPRGVVTEWDWTPGAEPFVIARVDSMHNDRWWLESETGARAEFTDLCATEAEALNVSRQKCEAQHEHNMQSRQRKRKGTKKAAWTVRYHREQIADLQRQIAWHQSRIGDTAKAAGHDPVEPTKEQR